MQVELRIRRASHGDALRMYLERRLFFALGRFADRVGRVLVRVHDINGPRGGVDKQCRITVALLPYGSVHLQETHTDLYRAVDRASHRLGMCVQRKLEQINAVLAR